MPLKAQLHVSALSSRNTAQLVALKFTAASGANLIAAASLLETSLTRSRLLLGAATSGGY